MLYVEREGAPVALFDEVNDYHECHNLIDEPEYKAAIACYQKMLYDEMEELDDNWDEEMIWPPQNWPTDEQRRAFRAQLEANLVLEVTRDAARGLPPRKLGI